MTTIFLTGATGYIGGSVAARLIDTGHRVRGLVRSHESAALLAERGIEPVMGSLDDANLLAGEARTADGVINTADVLQIVQDVVDQIALVILDAIMPRMSGRDTLRELAKIKADAGQKLLAGLTLPIAP